MQTPNFTGKRQHIRSVDLVRFRSEVMNSFGFGLPLDPIDSAENSARLPMQLTWVRVLATNKLPDQTAASPVVSGGRLYLRGFEYLWAIENGK